MDMSTKVSVLGVPISFACSTDHFSDINILGTDVLERGELHINYPAKTMRFVVTQKTVTGKEVWVQQCDRSGTPIGSAFEVLPSKITSIH
jgi:hypothetical protein